MTTDKIVNHTDIKLQKSIGVFQGMCIIIGIIIGSGIFVSPIGVLKYTNSVGMSMILWVLCGLFSALGSIVYAELGVTIPKSGGEYIYILESFGPLSAFICMWITFVTIGGVSLAANSLIFAQYILQPLFASCDIPNSALILVGLLGLASIAAINCYSVKWATRATVFFTISKVLALLIIIVIGFYKLFRGNVLSFTDPFADSNTSPGSLALAFYQGFWAYAGWNYLNFLTSEMINPARNLPIAIIGSLTIVTVIYVTTNIAYLAVLSPREMLEISSKSVAVAVVFADQTMGMFSCLMPIFVGASVFGSMNGEFLSVSRLTYTAAGQGHLPESLAMVSIKYLTPMPAVIFLAALSVVFTFTPSISYLIELAGFSFCVISGMAVSCLIYLRIKCPNLPRSFKLPLVLPIMFLLLDLFIGILTVYEKPTDSLIGVAIIALGIPIYIIFVVWKSKPKSVTNLTESLTIYIQKTFLVVPEEKEN
uniref:Slc7a-8 n=1 Tax=Schmidtea mediterranea TaxID=79327 RepID=A0A0H3YF65_SCHMD|nr:slc7a-8 [Schmidtea mediterranea]